MPTVFPLGHTVLFVDTVAPDANDDQTTIGVRRGYFWLNTSNSTLYCCTDSTEAAAVWSQIVDGSRDINTTNGITGGGALSSDLTLALDGVALALHQYSTGPGTDTTDLPRAYELGGAAFLEPEVIGGMFSAAKTASYQVVLQDFKRLLIATSGTLTFTLPLALDVPNGWWCAVKNRSGNNLSISRSGSDTMNAAATSVTIATGADISFIVRTSSSTFEVT